ncbi:hypothetical protein ER308_06405 [Egibacter rhizosphaerae]|uniref:Uncharacterized protein n=1 Tax=Egibacter rhizosphaerae TaxID=1670831 RepID=A0A411YDH6_9ACTN|nr:DUF5719 family protein [Egibacter rhizosphaerae]QBI19207.1 hypothetical protein ER308_06405 [Egibacter rhizosphaerae]
MSGAGSGEVVRTLLVVAVSIGVLLVVVDLVAAPPPSDSPVPVASSPPAAEPLDGADTGFAWCPVTSDSREDARLRIAAVDDEPSDVTVVSHDAGSAEEVAELVVPASSWRSVDVPTDLPVEVRWGDAPVQVTWEPPEDEPAGGYACADAPASTQYLPGLSTAGGSSSTVHLYNPFGTDAVADVRFVTRGGPEVRVGGEGVVVPAGEAEAIEVDELVPDEEELAATVEVEGGRLLAAADRVEEVSRPAEELEELDELDDLDDAGTLEEELDLDPDDLEGVELEEPEPDAGAEELSSDLVREGPQGRALLPATSERLTTAYLAYASVTEEREAWLEVHNPGERSAAVDVRVSNPGAEGAIGETSIPPETTVRIDLTDRSDGDAFGVTVESVNDVGIVASGFTARSHGDRRAFAGEALGGDASRDWRVGAPQGVAEDGALAVYNPGPAPASLTVDGGPGTPEAWEEQTLAAGDHRLYELDALPAPVPVRVSADEPVVAGHRSVQRDHGEHEDEGLVVGLSAPRRAWEPPAPGLTSRRDPSLLPLETLEP